VWYCSKLQGVFALLDYGDAPFLASSPTHGFFGVNCAATREALALLGPYRTDLGPTTSYGGGNEDVDMFMRALAAGMRVAYDPEIVVAHVIPESRTRKRFHRRRLFKGRVLDHRLVTKNAQPPTLLGLPRYLFPAAVESGAEFVRAVFRRDRGAAFYHELRLIRFAGLLERSISERLKRRLRGGESSDVQASVAK
jgi:hypothetical protein